MRTYEPRQGRKAATVVCFASAVVTLVNYISERGAMVRAPTGTHVVKILAEKDWHDVSSHCSKISAPAIQRCHRPGTRHPNPVQCHSAKPHRARLPFLRTPWHWQNEHCPHLRQMPELRGPSQGRL